MNHWLIKSEPNTYSIEDLKKDKKTMWEGVRNYAARNNLRAMKKGDLCLYYHSNIDKAVVGLAKVVKVDYPDPTFKPENSKENIWSVVDVAFVKILKNPVTLAKVKANASLKEMELVKYMRLSVQKVSKKEFEAILKMGE